MKTLLILGHTFPEPTTTAAGSRMMQLILLFRERGYVVHFWTAAAANDKSADLRGIAITFKTIPLNDSGIDTAITELNPTVVIFDRFITEEQFGWRIAELCPNALKILDTEDLHFLRKARETAIKSGYDISDANLYTETTKRELASILRCDLSLIISEVEILLLIEEFKVPKDLLFYLPFLLEGPSQEHISTLPEFESRKNFITIGNLQHQPNVDALFWLKQTIWPQLRSALPEAELHIYGCYASGTLLQLHDVKEGFMMKGWAPVAGDVMKDARICLAPLRYGAGLKGKIIDAMNWGAPSVTTTVGAEGICDEHDYPGFIARNGDDFADRAIKLYSDKTDWEKAQHRGFSVLHNRFQASLFTDIFSERINTLLGDLNAHRQAHFIGQVLQHKSLQAAKYMSRWIEAKNK